MNDHIVEAFEYDTDHGRPFIRRLRLSQAYFNSLKNHRVAICREAVSQIRNSAMTLDVYCWLCYRLPFVEKDVDITWGALRAQFGHGVNALKHLKGPFAESLKLARSVYPDARFMVTPSGVTLHPSSPPKRRIALSSSC